MMFLFRRDSLLHSRPSQIRRMQIHGGKIGVDILPESAQTRVKCLPEKAGILELEGVSYVLAQAQDERLPR